MTIEDIVEITQLMALYGHRADAAKHQPVESEAQGRLSDVFTDDAVFDATSAGVEAPWRGIGEIREMFARPKPAHTPSHMSTNVFVYEEGGRVRVKSKWFSQYWSNDGMRMGEYHDVVVRQDGGWRIRERVIVLLLE